MHAHSRESLKVQSKADTAIEVMSLQTAMDNLIRDKHAETSNFLHPETEPMYPVDNLASSKVSLRQSHQSQVLGLSMLSLAQQQLESYAPNSSSAQNISKRLKTEELSTHYQTDRGYSWVVLMSSFFLYLISLIPATTSGMLYVEYLDAFPGKEQATLWACSLNSALQFLFGFVLALVSEKLGSRLAAIIGSAGLGLSLCISCFTTSYILWFITYGILASLFSGLVFISSATATLKHFNKYKQTSVMIVNCAAGVTYFTFPPIVAQLLSSYGWREVNLFLGLLSLQGVILASLIRPPQKKAAVRSNSDSDSDSKESTSEKHEQQESYPKEQPTHYVMNNDSLVIENSATCKQKRCAGKLAELWEQWKPMLHWRMGVIMGLAYIIGYNMGTFFVSVPYYVEHYGVTPQGTAQLYMIGAIASLTVRISAALIGKFVDYDKSAAGLVALLIGAAGTLALTIQPSFMGFAIACVLISAGTGLIGVLQTTVILELHGEYRVELVFGMFVTISGVSGLIAPILTEILGKVTGIMASGYWCCTAQSVAAALLVIPHLVLKYSKQKHTSPQENLDSNNDEKDI